MKKKKSDTKQFSHRN